jgi:hypothetical protein
MTLPKFLLNSLNTALFYIRAQSILSEIATYLTLEIDASRENRERVYSLALI